MTTTRTRTVLLRAGLAALLPLAAATVTGCGSKIQGAVPSVTSLTTSVNGTSTMPAEACDQQVTTTVTVTGSGFQPLVVGALNSSSQRAVNPTVTLTDATGKATLVGNVVFVNSTTLTFDVTPGLGLAAGSYDLTVTNPDGKAGTAKAALAVEDPPTVTSVVPSLECNWVMDTVTVNGTGFQAGLSLTFSQGGASPMQVPASDIMVVSPSMLVVSLPMGTLMAGGPYDATVQNPDQCQGTEPAAFTEVPPPTVTSIQPVLVCSAQAAEVLVNGTSFRDTPSVAIGTVTLPAGDVRFLSSTQLLLSIPSGTLAASTTPYDVKVTNPEGNTAHCSATLPKALTVVPPPTVASVSPGTTCSYPVAPSTLTITGTGFRAGASVAFGATPVAPGAVTVASGTTLTVTLPGGLPVGGPYDVTVTNVEGCGATLPAAFTVDPMPTIASVVPSETCNGASRQVTIVGSSFEQVTTTSGTQNPAVTVGGTAIPASDVTYTSASILTVNVPSALLAAGGPYDVTVTNPSPNDCQATAPAALSVQPPPQLFYANPPAIAACGGGAATVITLYGENLMSGAAVTLTPDPTACPGVVATTLAATYGDAAHETISIPATLPSCSKYTVTSSDPDNCTATMAGTLSVTIGTPITLSSISPASAYSAAPEPVTITGTGFGASASVTLVPTGGGTSIPLGSVTVVSTTTVTAVVPPIMMPAGVTSLTFDVDVTSPATGGCSSSLPGAYTATSTPAFTLNQVTPPFGCASKDTNVTITATAGGTGIGLESTPRVYLHDTTSSVSAVLQVRHVAFINPSTITANIRGTLDGKTPAGNIPPGDYDVIVVNPDGTGSMLPYAFSTGYTETMSCPPEISSVSPNHLPVASANPVTITGMNFTSGAGFTVDFVDSTGNAFPATVVGTPTATSVTINVPAGAGQGVYLVRVTNPDGTFGVYASFVLSPPSNKLTSWKTETSQLKTARRALATVMGHDDLGNDYLYAIGGESGAGTPLSSVEVAPISIFGDVGNFTSLNAASLNEPTALNTATTGLVVAAQGASGAGTYLYAIGGATTGVGTGLGATTAALNNIEEAQVLGVNSAPAMPQDPVAQAGGSLGQGTWYYAVSAVYPAGTLAAGCPAYESLPSDEGVVSTDIGDRSVQVSWSGTFPTGTTFNVYRTAMVNGVSGSEVLLKSGVSGFSLVDTGALAAGTATPLPPGSLTTWCSLGNALSTARVGASLAVGPDPTSSTGGQIVYVLYGATTGGALVLPSYDQAPLSADGSMLGSFGATPTVISGGAAPPARAFAQAQFATNPNASNQPSVYLIGGQLTGGAADNTVYLAPIGATGALGTFAGYGSKLPGGAAEDGAAILLANNLFYAFGGQGGLGTVPSTGNQLSNMVGPGPFSSTSIALPGPTALMGYASSAAVEYLVGGTSTGTNATNAVYSTIY